GQHLDLGHAPFTLEIAAGDLAGRRCLLEVVHRERHEIDAGPHAAGCDRGDQHHRVAITNHPRTAGLLGHATGLDGELLAAETHSFTHEHVDLLGSNAAATDSSLFSLLQPAD